MSFDFSTILSLAIKWLSSGPTGIISGILGLGGIITAIIFITKKMAEAKYKNNLDRVSDISGSESSRLAHAARQTTIAMDALLDAEVKRQKESLKPAIIAPKEVQAGQPFIVRFVNIPNGLMIYADKNWDLKSVTAPEVRLLLFGAGYRTIDTKIGDIWHSVTVLVKKET